MDAEDVAALRERIERLEQENAMLKAAIKATPAGILIARAPDGVIEHWNPAAVGLRGTVDEEELTKIPVELYSSRWQTFTPDGQPYDPTQLPLARALLQGEVVDGEEVVVRDDQGHERWAVGHAAPVVNDEGERVGAVVVFPDITERKHAEIEALRFRHMAELSPDFVGIATPDEVPDYINPSLLALCGHPPDADVRQLSFADFHTPAAVQQIREVMLPAAARDGYWAGETELKLADGTPVPVSIVLLAHRETDGTVTHYSTTMRDLRPLRELEAQLAQSQRLESIGQLAGGVAHDFNNLLVVIANCTQLVRETLTHDDPRRADLDQVAIAAERASELCRQLLSFARRQVIQPQVLDLEQVIRELSRLLDRAVGDDVVLHTDVASDLWPVELDRSQLDQVLVNLVVNGRDAMPHGGELTIRAVNANLTANEVDADGANVVPGDYVLVSVTDTGMGMTPEVMQRVFEPFFSTKPSERSSGLGLATVHGAVYQNGGHLMVESTPGAGTTFRVYWPRAQAAAGTPETADEAPLRGGTGTVLVVEDQDMVRQLTVRLLRGEGYEVLEARSGQQALALEAKTEGPIDLLLTDMVMPHMNGQELAQAFAQRRPDARVLFVSGYSEKTLNDQGALNVASDFVSKPYSINELRQRIAKLLV